MSLLSWLHQRLDAVGAQANPFDNGATYNTVMQNKPVQPGPSVVQQVQNLPVLHPILQADRGMINLGSGLLHGIEAPFQLGAADLTNNPIARQNALNNLQAGQHAAGSLLQWPGQVAGSIGATVANHQTFNPTQGWERFLMGNQPVPSIQGAYDIARNQGQSIPNALTTAGLQAAQDIPVAIKGLHVATDKVALPAYNQFRTANEIGAVGKNVSPTPPESPKINVTPVKGGKTAGQGSALTSTELSAGKALGFTKKEITQLKQSNDLPKVFSDKASSLTPEELANYKPNEQMAIAQFRGEGPESLAPIEQNIAKNPYKSQVPNIEPGNYLGARVAPQIASRTIRFTGDRLQHALSQLKKTNPDEYKNFWKNIEKPPKNASPQLQEAAYWWRELANRGHAESVAAGKNTNYLQYYAMHPWELKNITEEQLSSGGPGVLGQRAINRKYATIAEGQKAGLKLGTDPLTEAGKYARGVSNAVERLVAKRALEQADVQNLAEHGTQRTLDLGYGHNVQLSEKGFRQARGLEFHRPSSNKFVKGLRTANVGTKSTLLSGGQFHPINISLLRAAPTLALKGHPVMGLKGLGRTFRPLLPGGKAFSERILGQAYKDGMVDKAAQISMPYGESGYNVRGTWLKSGVGHKLVFERQMPMMHDQVVRSIVSDLEKNGVPLNSPDAIQAGLVGNQMMGFMNKEAQNVSASVRQGMTDWLLAGQFTPSKLSILKKSVSKGGTAGSYARANVVANAMAATAIIAGIGYAMHQKSDNLKDVLLRAILDPAVPTPLKDQKGNIEKLRIPGTDTSDIAKMLGFSLKRGQDGHLSVDWNPHDAPASVSDWARARLSPGPAGAVKVVTNTTFAGKPLYDPNAPAGKKIAQAGTSLGVGVLPIGLQGLPMTNVVKSHLPGSVQEVLNAQTPGTNPLVKSIGSSFGLTPSTDTTVGKARDTATYFDAVNQYGAGLNSQAKSAFDMWTASKKNPVTGKYDVQPNVNDASTKASALLDNPDALTHMIAMNQNLASQGQKVDPLWLQPTDKIISYLQYQRMAPGGPDRSAWYQQNQSWYSPLIDQRNAFFNSLPPGDPNKPKLDLQYPQASQAVTSLENQYSQITDPTQRGQFINDHPELIQQWDAQAKYTNELRQRLGYSPLKNYPEATPEMQNFINQYMSADKATRSAIRNSHPDVYQSMIGYFDSVDLYNIGKQASVNMLQGQPDATSKELKAIQGLAGDIYQNPDGTYSIVPAGWMNGLSNGSGGSGSSNYVSLKKPSLTSGAPKIQFKMAKGAPKAKLNVGSSGLPKVKNYKTPVRVALKGNSVKIKSKA